MGDQLSDAAVGEGAHWQPTAKHVHHLQKMEMGGTRWEVMGKDGKRGTRWEGMNRDGQGGTEERGGDEQTSNDSESA